MQYVQKPRDLTYLLLESSSPLIGVQKDILLLPTQKP